MNLRTGEHPRKSPLFQSSSVMKIQTGRDSASTVVLAEFPDSASPMF